MTKSRSAAAAVCVLTQLVAHRILFREIRRNASLQRFGLQLKLLPEYVNYSSNARKERNPRRIMGREKRNTAGCAARVANSRSGSFILPEFLLYSYLDGMISYSWNL